MREHASADAGADGYRRDCAGRDADACADGSAACFAIAATGNR
jgi:hypothetical protein